MKLDRAMVIAERVRVALDPYCERIEVAGSVRRRKAEVGDIELVAIPRTVDVLDLFGTSGVRRVAGWEEAVRGLGRVVKGDPGLGRYAQVDLGEITLDLFLAVPENWGLIFAIRTGSAEFSHRVLAAGWVRAGYRSIDGMICRWGGVGPGERWVPVAVREEVDLFRLAGVEWTEPEKREVLT